MSTNRFAGDRDKKVTPPWNRGRDYAMGVLRGRIENGAAQIIL